MYFLILFADPTRIILTACPLTSGQVRQVAVTASPDHR
jgi:hypothetical protein